MGMTPRCGWRGSCQTTISLWNWRWCVWIGWRRCDRDSKRFDQRVSLSPPVTLQAETALSTSTM